MASLPLSNFVHQTTPLKPRVAIYILELTWPELEGHRRYLSKDMGGLWFGFPTVLTLMKTCIHGFPKGIPPTPTVTELPGATKGEKLMYRPLVCAVFFVGMG